MSEVIKYDPTKLMETVRDKIRASYVELIPEEQWNALVKKEVDAFFTLTDDYNHAERRNSPFRKLVFEELRTATKEHISKEIAKFTETNWENGQYKPNEMIKQFCVDNAGQILANMMASMFSGTVSQMAVQLRSQTGY